MANNDVNVVVYKILKYLYECKKIGKQPRHEDVMLNDGTKMVHRSAQ